MRMIAVLNLILSLALCWSEQAATAPLRENAWTHSCWLNGLRKTNSDTSRTLFAIETSRYGFCLDLANFGKAGFALRDGKAACYAESLATGTEWLRRLPPIGLIFEVELEGKTYRAISCKAGLGNGNGRFQYARLWESGRFVQHYDFLDLELRDATGAALPCKASLDLVAWPESLTLTGRLSPEDGQRPNVPVWKNAKCRFGLRGKSIDCLAEKTFAGPWATGETKELTVTHAVAKPAVPGQKASVKVIYGTTQSFPAELVTSKNCLVSVVSGLKRRFTGGYTDIRSYDDFALVVDSRSGVGGEVPFLLELQNPANITGLCPMLCDKEGRPTGVPVQLSKNWHHGAYLMAYCLLPAKPGKTEYTLRITYGFYGTLPSASHAQLSLVGYHESNGRWDQLAIGCWGETMCFDMDMTCVDIAITDVRTLMVRRGLQGARWSWSDAGWGGDWLGLKDAAGEKLPLGGMRTAYLAHGPCMSEVRYSGFYGAAREVSLEALVRTVRVDDFARTFQRLKYTFRTQVETEDVWLHKMGRTSYYVTPQLAYGNRDELIAQRTVPADLKPKSVFLDRVALTGAAPWWVAFPGARSTDGRDWGTGYRALVIRSYKATFGGKLIFSPTISLPVNKDKAGNLDLLLVAPVGIDQFRPGDTVEMDLEWITLPRCADDYYGPNESFRKHLAKLPSSWKTTYREARGNDLDVHVSGGELLEKYPIVIQARAARVEVRIQGGIGYVPIRFEGLSSATGYAIYEAVAGREVKLDQAVHGNDFWQADYDEAHGTYSLTYNLPLDDKPQSVWVLKTTERSNRERMEIMETRNP
jgi:hypothetical protein